MLKKSLIAMAALGVMVASVTAAENLIPEEELGLRKTALYTEDKTAPVDSKFDAAAPGKSTRANRSFENAPPLISHSVEGLLPITRKNNACLGCHMPDVAKSMNATPIPASHFVSFRPVTKIGKAGEVIKEGKAVKNTADVLTVAHKMDKLNQARFNCSQCHVPQADVKPLVENTFKPEFTDPALKGKSNLIDVMNEGVK